MITWDDSIVGWTGTVLWVVSSPQPQFLSMHALHPGSPLFGYFPLIFLMFLACRSSMCGHRSALLSFLYTSDLISGHGVLLARHGSHFLHLEAITTARLKMRPLYLWLSLKKVFMGWGGFSVSARLSPVTLQHRHTPTHSHTTTTTPLHEGVGVAPSFCLGG